MQVTINGEHHSLDEELSLADLLVQLDLAEKRIAVEVNEEIVPKSLHADTAIKADDHIEIIHAIGGG